MKNTLFIILLGLSVVINAQVDIPDAPKFNAASVIPEAMPAEVQLTWNPSDSLDVEGYYIFKVNDEGITNYLDTVYGRTTTNYTHVGALSNQQPETYRLAAFDTLDNISLLTDPHTTIFLTNAYDKCNLEVTLSWTPYIGWESIANYNIYRKKVGNPFVFLTDVSNDLSTFKDTAVEPNVEYCYYVEAVNEDGLTANSNQTCVYTNSHIPPAFINADYASVENEQIHLSFTIDTTAEVVMYKLQRTIDSDNDWRDIASFGNLSSKIFYIDAKVNPAKSRCYYRLQAIDPCNNVSATSNIASNIILNATSDEQLNHYLSWQDYENWQGNVLSYEIVKRYGNDVPLYVDNLSSSVLDYTINIADYVKNKHFSGFIVPSDYCYYVIAHEDSVSNPLGIAGHSKSNEVCVSHSPRIFVPNVFYPNSHNPKNRVFKPIVSFIKEDSYQFLVYDRWGCPLFNTKNPNEAWNGTIDDKLLPAGMYTYLIKYTDANDLKHSKSGVLFMYLD